MYTQETQYTQDYGIPILYALAMKLKTCARNRRVLLYSTGTSSPISCISLLYPSQVDLLVALSFCEFSSLSTFLSIGCLDYFLCNGSQLANSKLLTIAIPTSKYGIFKAHNIRNTKVSYHMWLFYNYDPPIYSGTEIALRPTMNSTFSRTSSSAK